VDFLAPCATGEMFGIGDVGRLRCRAIAGGANNPLVDDSVAFRMHSAGVLYVPDLLSNAGGVIQNAVEFNHLGLDALNELLSAANSRTKAVLEDASRANVTPLGIARSEALALVTSGAGNDQEARDS